MSRESESSGRKAGRKSRESDYDEYCCKNDRESQHNLLLWCYTDILCSVFLFKDSSIVIVIRRMVASMSFVSRHELAKCPGRLAYSLSGVLWCHANSLGKGELQDTVVVMLRWRGRGNMKDRKNKWYGEDSESYFLTKIYTNLTFPRRTKAIDGFRLAVALVWSSVIETAAYCCEGGSWSADSSLEICFARISIPITCPNVARTDAFASLQALMNTRNT